MKQEEVLKKVASALEFLKIPYMLTGAIAVNYYGRPRLTHNFDIIIELKGTQIDEIVSFFEKEFYISSEGIKDALKHKSMFNAIHHSTGLKVDFWLVQDDRYDHLRFKRRTKKKIFDKMVHITTPEDLIIIKLKWFKESGIEKHYADAMGVYQVQRKELDLRYLRNWLSFHSTKRFFEKILKEVRMN